MPNIDLWEGDGDCGFDHVGTCKDKTELEELAKQRTSDGSPSDFIDETVPYYYMTGDGRILAVFHELVVKDVTAEMRG